MNSHFKHLERIIIQNLLYNNNYILDFTLNTKSLVILHGMNGSGKTTLLKLINIVIKNKYDQLINYEFTKIEFQFAKSSSIIIKKTDDNEIYSDVIKKGDKIISDNLLESNKLKKNIISMGNITPSILRALLAENQNVISIGRDNDYPFYDKINDILIERPRNDRELRRVVEKAMLFNTYEFKLPIREYFSELHCNFIKTNRLVELSDAVTARLMRRRTWISSRKKINDMQPLNEIKQMLMEEITDATEKSARISRKFDTEFFKLLLEQVKSNNVKHDSRQVLNKQLEEIDKKQKELNDLGIYNISKPAEIERAKRILEESDETINNMFNAIIVFNSGLHRKFAAFDTLKSKLELFNDFLSNHLNGKTVIFSSKIGFKFKLNSDKEIEPWELSSGEQHIVLLAYYLIFVVRKNTLILIDEPEISLHLNWQRNLIANLIKISKGKELNFIIATHSPAIISSYQEDMLQLTTEDD